jgi:hypothetical protein
MRRGGVKLRDSFKQQVTLRAGNTCCKSMFQVFQMFHLNVVSVSCGYCKSRSGCCIYCNGYTRMLQTFVLNVSVVFPNVCCKRVYLIIARFHIYVACVLSECCIYFAMVFSNVFRCFYKCFRRMLQVSIIFERMLQMFHLNILKVDRVLHLPPRLLLPRFGVSTSSRRGPA